jgi:hypothetical protein
MRKVQVQTSPTGTAESSELDLTFFWARWKGTGRAGKLWSYDTIIGKVGEPLQQPMAVNATLDDCRDLIDSTGEWVRAAVEAEPADSSYLGFGKGSSSIGVKKLHYGSPFQLELLLPLLTPAGLAGLLFAAKRLYGIDLEFKAHREERRIEYLEAKARAEALSKEIRTPAEPPKHWQLIRGTLRDPPE